MKNGSFFLKNFLFSIIWLLCIYSTASAQISKIWDSQVSFPSNMWRYSVQTDKSGNTYIAYDLHMPDAFLYLKKYSSQGLLLWDRLVCSGPNNVSYMEIQLYIDSLNYPVVSLAVDTFTTHANAFIKTDTSGTPIWTISINCLPQNPRTTIDSDGNLFTAFYPYPVDSAILEKYDSSGVMIYHSSTYNQNPAIGIPPVIDTAGNAWFGYSMYDGLVRIAKWFKVNPAGLIVDSLIFNGNINPIAIDQHNNLYVGMVYYYPPDTNFVDSLKTSIRKYDAGMNLLWDTGPTSLGLISEIKWDVQENVYVYAYYEPFSIPDEFKVGKIDSAGSILWIHKFGLDTNGLSNYENGHLFLDASANPFVVGHYYVNGYQTFVQTDRFFVKRLDPNGSAMDLNVFIDSDTMQIKFVSNNGDDLYLMKSGTNNITKLCFCPSTISGSVYYDSDSSCTLNGPDHTISGAIVRIEPGSIFLNTDSSGKYEKYLPDNNYNVIFQHYLNYDHTCMIDTINITIVNGILVPNVNSGNYIDMALHDLKLNVGRGAVRPGFNTTYSINKKNAGGSIQSGSLDFVKDSLFTFIQSSPPPDTVIGDTLRWSFNSFLQGSSEYTYVTMYTPLSVVIGTQFSNEFYIYGNIPDIQPSDNLFIDAAWVTGSFDPNHKLVNPEGSGIQGLIPACDSMMHYTIHFENIGTDTAFTVLINDTIDPDLDLGSIQIGAASHPYTWNIVNSNVVSFRFDNIQLSDVSHPDENNGFINYFIRQKPLLLAGIQIVNSADIYFDFNQPIRTNQVINTIFIPQGMNESQKTDKIVLYPNPVTSWLTVSSDKLIIEDITLFDIKGKLLIFPVSRIEKKTEINLQGLNEGVYILRVDTKDGPAYKKIIKL